MTSDDNAVLRCLAILAASGLTLFGWEVWAEIKPRKVALWQGAIAALAVVAFSIAAGVLGLALSARVMVPLFARSLGDWAVLCYLPGPVVGLWAASIATQVIANGARRITGKPAQKLEFFAKPARKKRKKAAVRKPPQH